MTSPDRWNTHTPAPKLDQAAKTRQSSYTAHTVYTYPEPTAPTTRRTLNKKRPRRTQPRQRTDQRDPGPHRTRSCPLGSSPSDFHLEFAGRVAGVAEGAGRGAARPARSDRLQTGAAFARGEWQCSWMGSNGIGRQGERRPRRVGASTAAPATCPGRGAGAESSRCPAGICSPMRTRTRSATASSTRSTRTCPNRTPTAAGTARAPWPPSRRYTSHTKDIAMNTAQHTTTRSVATPARIR